MTKEALLGEGYKFDAGTFPAALNANQKEARRVFLDEIHAKGRYATVDNCPFCGASDFIKISERDAKGLPCEIVVCSACGACFKGKILDHDANRYHYERISYSLRGKDRSRDASEGLFKMRVKTFAYPRYSFIRHFAGLKPERDLVAEFGSGDGANLVPWNREGFDSVGIEFDPETVKFGRDKGLDLVQGDFMTYEFRDRKPKLVILSHLLEHVSDVNAVLRRIHSVLDPQGYLFIEVPGIKGQGLGKPLLSFDVEHNYYFDLDTLKGALNRNSFEMVYGDEFIRILCKPRNSSVPAAGVKTAHHHSLLPLLQKAEKGSIGIKLVNRFNSLYFGIYYNLLSLGAKHDRM
ncbi:MAG: methyltransferase domain-containing protein [Candidatus Omnitrophica bacterium]|nr:methyltransferase domain-containing protein [Candidatus Omnitrophota bacterium]MDD5736844.1 methyltransferase domain-containing protein [Candidatus Omnitrophota bacterium]